jgi:uncharacterized protein (TIGR03067 family)
MRARLLASLLAFAPLVVAAPVPKVVAKMSDAELLEGRWECVTLDGGQGPKADQNATLYWFTVRDGKLTTGHGDGKGYDGVTFKLDPEPSPKRIDITSGGVVLPCIYKLEDDTLTWCHPQDKQPRPTEFKGGNGHYCFVFKRAKDEKKDK